MDKQKFCFGEIEVHELNVFEKQKFMSSAAELIFGQGTKVDSAISYFFRFG
jgi:hypothetical protein